MTGELITWIAYGLAPIGAGAILLFLFNLIRAPVFIKFENETKPHLTVEKVVESKYGKMNGESWGLVVHNQGIDRADDCQGLLLQIEFADPSVSQTLHTWPTNQPLQWENIPDYSDISISILGLSSVVLQIANRDGMRDQYAPKKHELHL